MRLGTMLVCGGFLLATSTAAAQPEDPPAEAPPAAAPPAAAPPGQAPPPAAAPPGQAPPPGYGYPPPPGYGYPPPGGVAYGYPPPNQKGPPRVAYKEGQPVPAGYHVEEQPRQGLVIAGWIVSGIGYGIGLLAATSADFTNESGWMVVPFAGPWLTIGRRQYCDEDPDPDAGTTVDCLGDVFAVMGLIFDGVVQAAGGTMLLIGYLAQKEYLVRDDVGLWVSPTRVGSGYGLGLGSRF